MKIMYHKYGQISRTVAGSRQKHPQKVLPHRPGGRAPSMAGQNQREKARIPKRSLEFRKPPVPDPLRKTEPLVRPGQPRNFPTRTHERVTAHYVLPWKGCASLGPGQSPPTGRENKGRRIIDRNHSPDWEKTPKNIVAGRSFLVSG